MSQKKLDELIEFVKFTHKFQQVKRVVYATGENRLENDAEHCFQIAMVGWYLIEKEKLKLDLNKVIKYALVHDLVEVYAGDISAFDNNSRKNKAANEKKAYKTLVRKFPKYYSLKTLIINYEIQADAESRFIYALDKLIVPINIYLDGGRSWKKEGVTLDMIIENKTKKIAVDPFLLDYLNELIKLLKENKVSLW